MSDCKSLAPVKTRYSNLSDSALRSMFTESSWMKLSKYEKLDVLQETVNREALNNGAMPCKVSFENMASNMQGCQFDDKIMLNREMFVDNQITYKYGDTSFKFDMEAPNYSAYEVVLHEYRHSLQQQISDGKINADSDTKARFESNNFTVSEIDGQRASQYMLGKTGNGYDMYYLNPTELDAHKFSQEQAMALVNEHRAQNGDDNSILSYTEKISATGYEAKLAELKEKYGENIDKDVEQVLINKFNNTNVPVDKNVEKMVASEMIASQQAIDNANKNEINNISSTNAVSENYSSTVDEFDAAQANAVDMDATVSISTDTSADSSVSADAGSGIDGGYSSSV
ncbi:MAG: hypothetical protein J1E81_02415 [Eubacterium sp.]|nr:hypothetical protein [Eubacterium sp.]